MVKQIKRKHIEKYVSKHTSKELSKVHNPDLIFEAVCEMIVTLNPEYKIEQISKEYNSQDKSLESFLREKFQSAMHKSTDGLLSEAQINQWIKYTKQGIKEYNYTNNLS